MDRMYLLAEEFELGEGKNFALVESLDDLGDFGFVGL